MTSRARTARVILLSALMAVAAMPATAATAAQPGYFPSGPQANVPKTSLTGWQECYSGAYNSTTPLSGVLSACDGQYLMLAGSSVGSNTLTLLAAAPRADVLFDTAKNTTTAHQANGSGWYFENDFSWGFAPGGQAIQRAECDVTSGALRLCWATNYVEGEGGQPGGLNPGYRLGDVLDLYSATGANYTRHVYMEAGTTASATPTLLAFGPQIRSTITAAQTITIVNNTAAAMNMTDMTLGGTDPSDFYLGYTNCFRAVPAGSSCRASVAYAPQPKSGAPPSPDNRSATISFVSDVPTNSVTMTGTAVDPPPGPAGPTGPAGANGADGTDGADGADGATGPTGPAGPAGGPQGPPGPAGATGANGADGATGAAGPSGAPGPQGVPGAQGAPGPQGAQGEKGDRGPRGRSARSPKIRCNKSKKAKRTCRLIFPKRSWTATASATASYRVTRKNRFVAAGMGRLLRAKSSTLRMRPVSRLRAGRRYEVTIKGRDRAGRTVIVRTSVRMP